MVTSPSNSGNPSPASEAQRQGRQAAFDLRERTAMLQRLSAQLARARDEERRKIARALHDSVGQSLVVLKINLDLMQTGPPHKHAELLAVCLREVEQCLSETRTISHLLHPPLLDVAGLRPAAQWYVEEFARRSNMPVNFYASPGFGRLPDEIEIALFRALQESLTNVHRHSGSEKVEIRLDLDAEHIVLMVKDFGHGMPPNVVELFRNHAIGLGVGLAGMRERVYELHGSVDLESDSKGTTITVNLPLTPDGDHMGDSSAQTESTSPVTQLTIPTEATSVVIERASSCHSFRSSELSSPSEVSLLSISGQMERSMFARNLSLRLRPNTLNEFRRIFDAQIIPLLRKQPGFKDVMTFAMTGGSDVIAISLWETKEHAEGYSTAGYPEVLKSLEPILDANPKLRVADIVNSTFHKHSDVMAA